MTEPTLRQSQAAVALIRVRDDAGWKYLCRWSLSWQAFHFVGGHREGVESFQDCAVREVLEELPVAPADVSVATEPMAHLEYVAFSESARQPTHYVMEVFKTDLSVDALRDKVEPRPENRWVSRDEIRAGRAVYGIRVRPPADLILSKLGL
jgi:8-oxo-dGTP pyrophosphatase MutT (NUDIX family)